MKISRRIEKKFTSSAGRIAVTATLKLAKKLNPRRIDRLGRILGDIMYYGSARYRRVGIDNLVAAYPDWPKSKVVEVTREVFRNFAKSSLEFFYLHYVSREDLDSMVTIEGTEYLDDALDKGKGVILITAHLGNWEAFARKLALLGYPVNVIARDSDDVTMTGVVNELRENGGYKVLPRDSAALPSLRCLKKNELLGILPDQNTHGGVFVDFFGRPVATATGPAVFALKSGAPIVCGYAKRDKNGGFHAVIYPPLEIPLSGDNEADITTVTAAITKAIEEEVRRDPAEWLWIHNRWKRSHEITNK